MQIVGLDVGYSNLKVAFGQAGQHPQLRVLPSMAAPRACVAAPLKGASRSRPAGVPVLLDGEAWVAGVPATRVSGWQRALHADYAASDGYRALLLAALSLPAVGRVDRLVTGLPVSQAADAGRREALRSRIVGRHVTHRGALEVADVRVIAQPVGTFVDVQVRLSAELHPELFAALVGLRPRGRAERLRQLALLGLSAPRGPGNADAADPARIPAPEPADPLRPKRVRILGALTLAD